MRPGSPPPACTPQQPVAVAIVGLERRVTDEFQLDAQRQGLAGGDPDAEPVVVARRLQRAGHHRARRDLLRALEVVRLLLANPLRRSGRSRGLRRWHRSGPPLAARAKQRRDEPGPPHLLARSLGTRIQLDGELPVEFDDPLGQLLRRVALLREVPRLEPDAAAALARLVDERVALVLAFHGQQSDVIDRALSGVLLGVCAPAHRLQGGQPVVKEDAVEVRDVEPETSALGATKEETVLSVGELGHLRIVARAIHGFVVLRWTVRTQSLAHRVSREQRAFTQERLSRDGRSRRARPASSPETRIRGPGGRLDAPSFFPPPAGRPGRARRWLAGRSPSPVRRTGGRHPGPRRYARRWRCPLPCAPTPARA